MKTFYLSALGLLFSATLSAQDCEVLVPALQGKYSGDCKSKKANGIGKAEGTDTYDGNFKNGYPAGEGTYTFKNGDYYKGNFKKGVKDGKGEFHYKRATEDSVVLGYWKNDTYIGNYLNASSLEKKSQGMYNVEIHEEAGQSGKLVIISENQIKANSLGSNTQPVIPVITYIDIKDGGTFEREEKVTLPRASSYTLYGVKFPFHAVVHYQTEEFEVIISKPGSWRINAAISSQ